MKPLFAIRDVLQKQDMASASQMAAELKLFVGLVEDMLAYWQRRGAVEQVSVGTRKSCGSSCSSGGCGSCSNASCVSRSCLPLVRRWGEGSDDSSARRSTDLASTVNWWAIT